MTKIYVVCLDNFSDELYSNELVTTDEGKAKQFLIDIEAKLKKQKKARFNPNNYQIEVHIDGQPECVDLIIYLGNGKWENDR